MNHIARPGITFAEIARKHTGRLPEPLAERIARIAAAPGVRNAEIRLELAEIADLVREIVAELADIKRKRTRRFWRAWIGRA